MQPEQKAIHCQHQSASLSQHTQHHTSNESSSQLSPRTASPRPAGTGALLLLLGPSPTATKRQLWVSRGRVWSLPEQQLSCLRLRVLPAWPLLRLDLLRHRQEDSLHACAQRLRPAREAVLPGQLPGSDHRRQGRHTQAHLRQRQPLLLHPDPRCQRVVSTPLRLTSRTPPR